MKNVLAGIGVGLALMGGVAGGAVAAGYPERPVHIIIGFPPGGAIDTIARVMGPPLSERLGQPVVIENQPGAGGIIAAQRVARAEPDGSTVLMGTMGNLTITPSLMKDLNFDVAKDLTAVTVVASSDMVLYVNPKLPVKTVSELIAYARENPSRINFSSSGNGGLPHMAGELFNSAAGLKLMHVPYKGSSPSISDVIAGQVQMTIESTAIGLPFVQAGQLRALGTTGTHRMSVLPDVPTISETLPGFEVMNWFGIVAPAKTPADRIARLQKEIATVLADPAIKQRLAAQGVEVVANTPAEAGRYMAHERERWANVIKDARITID